MLENLLSVLIIFLELAPVVFVFIVIARIMYKNSKARADVSLGGLIFSWVFFAFYALAFSSLFVFPIFGKKEWMKYSFIAIVGSLVFILLVGLILALVNKYNIKHREKFNVQAKLVGAVEKKSVSIAQTGMSPQNINLYSLLFEYNDGDEVKTCTSVKLYTLAQIAYLKRNNDYINISVYKNICELHDAVEVGGTTYDVEDIKDLKITSIESSGSEIYYTEIFAGLVFTVPIFLGSLLAGLINIDVNPTISLVMFAMGLFTIAIPLLVVIPRCKRLINTNKHGEESFAVDFELVGRTNTHGTYCVISYSYETEHGLKKKKEHVTLDKYGKIEALQRLPIKVYKNMAVIDVNKIV